MKKFSFKTILALAAGGFLLYLGIHYWPSIGAFFTALFGAALPLIIGFLIAYIVNIVMSAYERTFFKKAKKKWLLVLKRPLCMTAAFLSFFAVVALVIGLIIPQLVDCIRLLVGMVPGAIDKAIDFFDKYHLLSDEVLVTLDAIDWKSRVQQLVDVVTSGVTDVVTLVIQTLQSVISGVITAFLSFIFSIYLLVSKEKLKAQANRLCTNFLPEKFYKTLLYVTFNFNISAGYSSTSHISSRYNSIWYDCMFGAS